MTFTLDDLDGVDLHLPTMGTAHCNPHYDTVRPAFQQWLDSARESAPDIDRATRLMDYLRISSFWWPRGPAKNLLDVAKLQTVFFLRDDAADADAYQAAPQIVPAALADCRSGHTTATDPVWGPLLAEIWADIGRYTSPAVMQRVRAGEEDLLNAYLDSYAIHSHGGFETLEQFLRVRAVTFGCPLFLIFAEVANGSDYSGLIDHPEAQNLLRSHAERLLLYDGLASIRKEVAQGNPEDNIIAVLACLEQTSLAEAVGTVRQMWDNNKVRHQELSHRLLEGPLGTHPYTSEMLDTMNTVLAGLIAATAPSARYHPDSADERH